MLHRTICVDPRSPDHLCNLRAVFSSLVFSSCCSMSSLPTGLIQLTGLSRQSCNCTAPAHSFFLAAEMLLMGRTRYVAPTACSSKMVWMRPGGPCSHHLHPLQSVHICRRFTNRRSQTGGNEIPVCPYAISGWYPGVHQELVYRLPGDGPPPHVIITTLDRHRR